MILLILLFFRFLLALNKTGEKFNSLYPVAQYYGSRDKEFLMSDSILNDNLVVVKWTRKFDFNYNNTKMYVAVENESVIRSYELKTEGDPTQGTFNLIAGSSFSEGHIDSKPLNSLFNRPKSLLDHPQNSKIKQLEEEKQVIILKIGCLDNSPPYSEDCLITDKGVEVSINQIRISYSENILPLKTESHQLIVADTDNHCIRLINLKENTVKTIAGICGTEGFKDGPIGKNKFRFPTTLGSDNLGNIWIYDKGNSYLRKLAPQEEGGFLLSTMLKGTCRNLPENLQPEDHSKYFHYTVCYEKWIKNSGEPTEHIYNQTFLNNFCTEHFENCDSFQSHTFYRGVQVYNESLK